jgi:transposase-like protein
MARIPSMTELPSPNTRRWVARRKAAVVAAVSSGRITIEEACRRYHMSEDEFFAWQRAFETQGIHGLYATRVQHYRIAHSSRPTSPGSPTENSMQQSFTSDVKKDLEGSSIPASMLPEKS